MNGGIWNRRGWCGINCRARVGTDEDGTLVRGDFQGARGRPIANRPQVANLPYTEAAFQLTALRLNFLMPMVRTAMSISSSAPIVITVGMCGTCGTSDPRMPSLA